MTIDNVNNDLQDLENYLKNIKNKGCDESDLNIILNVLQCPVFNNIVKVQNSLKELKKQYLKYPKLDGKNFNITSDGRLELIDIPQDDEQQQSTSTSKDDLDESKNSTTDDKSFWEYIEKSAKGREIVKINLFKSDNECLGFNVVGLRAEHSEDLGIFVQNIAKNGIADREGSLQLDDQILAINKEILDSDMNNEKAIDILKNARGHIELIVAKSTDSEKNKQTSDYSLNTIDNLANSVPNEKSLNNLNLSSTSINDSKNELELNQFLQNEPGLERFSQIELIELVNTGGKGLGFGILGGKSTGVIIKTILPGSLSDKDGRLKSGDHILQINNVTLRGMSSEQVAQVLRSAGTNVKLLVARQKPSMNQMNSDQNATNFSSLSTTEANIDLAKDYSSLPADHEEEELEASNEIPEEPKEDYESNEVSIINQINEEEFDEQEVESIDVELVKDKKGLGITIAGYVCEKEDISGIYVKSIAEGSAADLSGKIQVNDQIIEVDGISLLEFTNHEAVEVLRNTGKVVKIKLARYLKGNKFDRLQVAINNADFNVVKPLTTTKPNQTVLHLNSENRSAFDTVDNNETSRDDVVVLNLDKIKYYWQNVLGDEYEIVISSFTKFEEIKGLGISLEGTIETEPGKEPTPHHYIKKISESGPIGRMAILRPGDEILQVNNTKVYGMDHKEVVTLLRELPMNVVMVCARLRNIEKSVITLNQHHQQSNKEQNIYENYLTGDLLDKDRLVTERLVKAKSDGSLAIVNSSLELLKIKSRSLEPISGLAMWSSEPVSIELEKGSVRGLGFSILDYQDPLNPNETVIVIRSLVQGGVAQQNGNLMPGDRLLAVNDISLENASLDLAVQALKGAKKGIVKLLVAKPLPINEQNNSHLVNINYTNFSTTLNKNLELPVLHTDDIQEMGEIEQQSEGEFRPDTDDWKSVDLDDFEKADILLKENLERSYINKDDSILINRSRSYSALSMQLEMNYTDDSGYTEFPIPTELEKLIILHKKKQSLGVTLELSEQGINGLIVRSLNKKGLIYKDGRIQCGDNILSINHESLRNTTTSKARAIFKRVNLVEGDIPLKYVPECESSVYRRKNTSLIKSKNRHSLPCFKNYCRTPSPTIHSMNPFYQ